MSILLIISITHIHATSTYHLLMPNQVFFIELLSLDAKQQQQQQQIIIMGPTSIEFNTNVMTSSNSL